MDNYIKTFTSTACEYFGIDEDTIYTHKRGGDYDIARQVIWYYLHCEKNYPTSKLALNFNRSRRKIFQGIANVREGMKFQEYYSSLYKSFVQYIYCKNGEGKV